jgi:HEPN domain-containing protein
MDEVSDISILIKEWLRHAKDDLSSAEFLLGKWPLPTEIICFHCQQCAEKLLKGIMVIHGITPPKTHNLIELFNLCKPLTIDIDKIKFPCDDLNAYSVSPRYPDMDEITEQQMRKALADAKAVMDFALPLFP